MRKTTAQYDTERPLTPEERLFAEKNHDLIYIYCKKKGLYLEDWYDIFAVAYLQAVKKYFEIEKLQQYPFPVILYKDLHRAYGNYCRDMTRQKRMPEGGFVYLDYTMESDNIHEEKKVDAWWIDRKKDVETQCIDKSLIEDILKSSDATQRTIFNLLLQGYSHSNIIDAIGFRYYSEYIPVLDALKSIVHRLLEEYAD